MSHEARRAQHAAHLADARVARCIVQRHGRLLLSLVRRQRAQRDGDGRGARVPLVDEGAAVVRHRYAGVEAGLLGELLRRAAACL